MKPSAIYLKAARTLGEPVQSNPSEFSCTRIGQVSGLFGHCPARIAYSTMFNPYAYDAADYRLSPTDVMDAADEVGITPKDFRIMMLCMMAAIADRP